MTIAATPAAVALPPAVTSVASLTAQISDLTRTLEQIVARISSNVPPAVAGGGGATSGCSCGAMQAVQGVTEVAPATDGANAAPTAAYAVTPRSNDDKRDSASDDSDEPKRTRRADVTGEPNAASPSTKIDESKLRRKNPRSVEEMLAFVRKEVANPSKDYYRRCGHFSAFAYGWNASGVDYAIDQWRNARAEDKHAGDTNPPAGALVFWETGSRAGHVAVSMGNGMVASNDIRRRGKIDIVPLSEITKKWGAKYQGWTPPDFPKAA